MHTNDAVRLAALVAVTAGGGCATVNEQIAALEDARAADTTFLRAEAQAADPQIRVRALRALGRLQRVEERDTLERALSDPEPAVRSEAAFELGQLGLAWEEVGEDLRKSLEQTVTTALGGEKNEDVRVALAEALGRVGAERSLETLTPLLRSGPPPSRRTTALAVGSILYRHPSSPLPFEMSGYLGSAMNDADAGVRRAATYAAMRLVTRPLTMSAPPPIFTALIARLADADDDVRALAARGLGSQYAALAPLLKDPVARVAAEAARAAARSETLCTPNFDSCATLDFARAVLPPNLVTNEMKERSVRCWAEACDTDTRFAALIRPTVDSSPVPAMIAMFNEPILGDHVAEIAAAYAASASRRAQAASGSERRDLAVASCYAAAASLRAGSTFKLDLECPKDLAGEALVQPLVRRALGEARRGLPARIELATKMADSPMPAVREAAAEAFGKMKGGDPLLAVVHALLGDTDVVVAATAAESAAAMKDGTACVAIAKLLGRLQPADVDPLLTALKAATTLKCEIVAADEFLRSTNETVRSAAASLIEANTGHRPTVPRIAELPGPYASTRLPAQLRVRVVTSKGDFELELFPEDAPHTCQNFLYLVRKRFYDGLKFHRVVPNFVVQGGDPRGDGSGGPPFTIRCEINRRLYERGTLGMALSGKDTGGSQFFVTLSPQPHLDGRYTVFGRISSGMDVVDRIVEGDAISRIEELP